MPKGVYIRTKECNETHNKAFKGRIPWNKGLTKNEHESLRIAGQKIWESRRKNGTDKVSDETREKLSECRKNEWENGIRKAHNNPWNRGLTSQTDKRVAKNAKNRKGITSKYEKSVDIERRRKIRIAVINNIKKYRGTLAAFVGKNETQLLNEQEQLNNCKIERQFEVLGYIVDGYDKENNVVYEIYEKHHDKKIEHDLQ
jgi:hypothetical protein